MKSYPDEGRMQSLIIPHKNKGHRLTCGGAQNNYSIFFRTQHLGHYWYCLLRIFLTVALDSTTTHADNNKNIKYTTLVSDQWQRFACNLVELLFQSSYSCYCLWTQEEKRAGQRDYNSIFIKSVHRSHAKRGRRIYWSPGNANHWIRDAWKSIKSGDNYVDNVY